MGCPPTSQRVWPQEAKTPQTRPTSRSLLASRISKIWNVNPSKFKRIQSRVSSKLTNSVFSLKCFRNAKFVIIACIALATACSKSMGKESQSLLAEGLGDRIKWLRTELGKHLLTLQMPRSFQRGPLTTPHVKAQKTLPAWPCGRLSAAGRHSGFVVQRMDFSATQPALRFGSVSHYLEALSLSLHSCNANNKQYAFLQSK